MINYISYNEFNNNTINFNIMLNILEPSQYQHNEVNLGDKIIKTNQFNITIPNNGLLLGIKHLSIIQNVYFLLSNFKKTYRIEAILINNKYWSISNYLIPLFKLLEYSNDLKLEVEIHVNNTKKNKFYSFDALFVDTNNLMIENFNLIKNTMYLTIPLFNPTITIEIIANIWRIVIIQP